MKTLLIILLTISLTCQGQDLKYASINIISSSLISGVGAGIHKHSNETFFHAFKAGCWKGAIGGAVQFTSKKMIQQSAYENNFNWIWPARTIDALGTSIVTNGVQNEKIFSSFNMNLFFISLTYDKKLHCRFDPYTLGSAVVLSFNKNMTFNFENSLYTGSLLFYYKKSWNNSNEDGSYGAYGETGINLGNTIYVKDFLRLNDTFNGDQKYIDFFKSMTLKTICHELTHSFQYNEYNSLNGLFLDNLTTKLHIYKYLNINLNFAALYLIANIQEYKYNYFENEAEYCGRY